MSDADPSSYQASASPSAMAETGEKKSLGCFFWGCMSVIALGVLMIALFFGGGYLLLAHFRDTYTATQPVALAEVRMDEAERGAVRDEYRHFREALKKGTASDPLVLGPDDLNALIAGGEFDPSLAGTLRVGIEGDRLSGELSYPLDSLPFPGMKGRYLNAEAELKPKLDHGMLAIDLDKVSVKGEALPAEYVRQLESNINQRMRVDPNVGDSLRHLASVEIADGKMTLIPESASEPAGQPVPEATP